MPGAGRREEQRVVFNGYRVLVEDEKVLVMDGIGGCTTIYIMPQNCILKNGSNDKFKVIYILPGFF